MTGSAQWVRVHYLDRLHRAEIVHARYVEHRFVRHAHALWNPNPPRLAYNLPTENGKGGASGSFLGAVLWLLDLCVRRFR